MDQKYDNQNLLIETNTQTDTSTIDYSNVKSLRNTNFRWLGLLCACLLIIGSYICYDFPGILNSNIQTELKVNATQINLLYTVYAIPNVVLPLIGGYLVDIIGVRKGVFIFSFILVIGQVICAIGASKKDFNTILSGRVVFGLGGEILNVVQSAVISQWFQGKEISLAFALNIAIGRLGTVGGSIVFSSLYSSTNSIYMPLVVGCIICVFSMISGICLNIMDKIADRQEGKLSVKIENEEKPKLSDIKLLKLDFWLITLSCCLTYISLFCFLSNLQDYITKQFKISSEQASSFFGLPYLIGAFLTPFLGCLLDKYGRRGIVMIIFAILAIISHALMIMVPQCRDQNDINCQSYSFLIPLIIFGLFYALQGSVLWACISIVVDPKLSGTAYGITTCIYNIGLTIAPIIISQIIVSTQKDNGYYYMQIFFILVSILLLITNIFIHTNDLKNGRKLHKSLKEAELTEGMDIHQTNILRTKKTFLHQSFGAR